MAKKLGTFQPSALLSKVDSITEPSSFTQANRYPQWRKAMSVEIHALLSNGTWFLVPHSPSMNVLGCKWVFKIKQKVDGTIERYKARFVAKGYQEEGLNYEDM